MVDEIVEELKREGFELDGIDEELFIQDVEVSKTVQSIGITSIQRSYSIL